MNILVDNSGYELGNLGDVAMLQVAVRRLGELWPSARTMVVTSAPELLREFCPRAVPVPAEGLASLISLGRLPGHWRIPQRLLPPFMRLEARVRESSSEALDALARRRATGTEREAQRELMDAVEQTDLLVVSGGGFFTDCFEKHARSSLDLLRRVRRRGAPAALLGHGIGPLSNGDLRRQMRALFPGVALFGLREGRIGPRLLEEFGVAATRIAVTGDDAIELGHAARRAERGGGLGLNVRVARYSGLEPPAVAEIGRVVGRVAAELPAPLVPLPIARARGGEDIATLDGMLAGWEGEVDRSSAASNPNEAVARVARCRLVVVGSYHAAVFALAQGIPAVGLAASEYYASKFLGLQDLFGPGCTTVHVGAEGWKDALRSALLSGWEAADELKPGLLASARRQIEIGRQNYARLPGLLDTRRKAHA